MTESDWSDLFSEVSDVSYQSDLDNTPISFNYDLDNGSPIDRDKFKIVHFNINSLTAEGRLETLTDLCKTLNIHVLILTESKLDETIPNNNIAIPGYHDPIRHDREINGRQGGGCIMYVSETLSYKHNVNKQSKHFEHIWVDVKADNKTIAVNCLYRPPNETAVEHELFLNVIDTLLTDISNHEADLSVIASDLNFGNCYCVDPQLEFKPLDFVAPEIFSSHNFKQLIDRPTRVRKTVVSTSVSLIDLLFVNSQDLVEEYGTLPEIADHSGILLSLNLKLKLRKPTKKTILDYNNFDLDGLKTCLKDFDFHSNVFNLPVEEQADKFTNILKDCIKTFIPTKQITILPQSIPWCNTYTRLLLRKKNRNYKLFKSVAEKYKTMSQNNDTPAEVLTKLRQKLDKVQNNYKTTSKESLKGNRRAKQSFYNSVNNTMQNNEISARKKFSILAKLLNNKKYSSIATLIENGSVIEDSQNKSEILNKYFTDKSKVSNEHDVVPELDKIENVSDFSIINTSPLEVAKLMRELKKSKMSYCGIPGKIISLISTTLSFPFSRLLNNLFEIGHFPSVWKMSHVTAIYKFKGQKSDKTNYRPISLLPTLSKLAESIIHKRLLGHCTEFNIISERQAAYLKGDSTIHQLLYIVDKIKKEWTKSNITHGIFLDVKAAFDKVWHKGLLAKLEQIGVTGQAKTLFASYLSDRKQSVVVDGCVSSVRNVSAGVPQGSRLGPLLFIIYINDIVKDIESEMLIFADDTSLLVSGKNTEITSQIIKRDLTRICKWANDWKVSFNADKTEEIIFSKTNINSPQLTLNNENIKRVHTHKHLGLFLTSNLDWSAQIHYVCLRANRKLAVIRKNKMLNRQTLDMLYKVTVRSVIDYGLPIYYQSLRVTEKARLEQIQYRAAKIVTGVSHQA